MKLSEIREERKRTRLKTNRWHELNAMEHSRIAEINASHGHEANGHHGSLYHKAKVAQYQIQANGKGLMDYVHRSKSKKMVEQHTRLIKALEE